jgi:hypothetical protein
MIKEVADYFRNEVDALQRQKDVDVMSKHHYHIVFVYQDMVVKNLVRGYAKILGNKYKAAGGDTQVFAQWIRDNMSDIQTQAVIVYNSTYAIESNLKRYYPKAGTPFKFTTKGTKLGDFKLILPPGVFADRKFKGTVSGSGNVPYINQMFAGIYEVALVALGDRLHKSGLSSRDTRGTDSKGRSLARAANPRNITHGRVRGGKLPLQTTAEYGLARRFAGISEGGEFIQDEDIDTRIKRDSSVASWAKKVGDKTAVQIIDLFKNAVSTEFKLTDIRNTTLNELNRKIAIELEYADAAHNKMMEGRDASGIKRFINRYENKLLSQKNIGILSRRYAASAVDIRGSQSLRQKAIAVTPHTIIKSMFPHKSRPNMRLRVNKKMVADAMKSMGAQRGSTKTSLNKTSNRGKKRVGNAALVGSAIKGSRRTSPTRVDKAAGTNPMALRNLLNEILPMTVAQNMTSPALNYRTGRFANSVRVDNITQGPRGGNTMIEATYMTNPYDTFAPGGQKYTPQRDPERLIKRSIRQVASGMIGAKFGINIQ